MSLKKIISIKNVGRFRNSAAAGDLEFVKYNLIFAENGRGKTTLCAILRSLQSGDVAHVTGRRTLGVPAADRPEITLRLDGSNAIFKDGAWNCAVADLAIFDATFITENVYSGESVSVDNKRNLYRVIVGKEGVALANAVDGLDAQIRAKNTEIRNGRAALQPNVPTGFMIEAFVALPEDADIDNKIGLAQRELEAARQAGAIRERPVLAKVAAPDFPAGFVELLGKSLEDVSADAEQRVAAQIANHEMHERGETWLAEGVGHVRNDTCPFCAQGIAGNELIAAYRAFFSAQYREFRDEIGAFGRRIDQALSDREISRIERLAEQNKGSVEFWSRFSDIVPPPLANVEGVHAVIAELRQAAVALIERKANAPLEQLQADARFAGALAAYDALRPTLAAYDVAVDAANVIINAKKAATGATTVTEAERALGRLQAIKKRHEPAIKALCDDFKAKNADKGNLEQQKEEAKKRLDEYTARVIGQYETTINRLLDRFNAGFQIANAEHGYPAGQPSSSYKIKINGIAIDLGDSATPLDRPSFRNTLSSGDRSTLALAFFLAQLEHDPARANRIVVFDDPFNSQDSFRRSMTASEIKNCGDMCKQVLVLSHDPSFLKLVWEKVDPASRKTFMLARIGVEHTAIAAWDIHEALKTQFRADLDALKKYYDSAYGHPREVVQKLRPVLEAYCKFLYPSQFDEADTFGDIIRKIRDAGAAHPLSPVLRDLEEINGYSRRYHHGDNPHAATEPLDASELLGFVRRTAACVGGFIS